MLGFTCSKEVGEVERLCLILHLGLERLLPKGEKTGVSLWLQGRRNTGNRPRPGKGLGDSVMARFMCFPALPSSLIGTVVSIK